MATWEDGPEYAPVERPAEFAAAATVPLSTAPPVVQMAAYAPKERPGFAAPPAPVAPLETLVPTPADRRDPEQPFAVVSATLTSDSAWGAVHWGPPSGPPVGTPTAPTLPPGSPFPAPGPVALPPPTAPLPNRPLPDGSFPAPGTPAWFGPGPYGEQPPPPGRVTPRAVWEAAMPGLCICLAVGGLVWVLAPILYAIAFGLAGRVQVARARVRRAFAIGSGVLGLVAIVATLTNDLGFGEWWRVVGGWSLVACWALLVTTLVLVYRALRAGEPPEPPAPGSVWA